MRISRLSRLLVLAFLAVLAACQTTGDMAPPPPPPSPPMAPPPPPVAAKPEPSSYAYQNGAANFYEPYEDGKGVARQICSCRRIGRGRAWSCATGTSAAVSVDCIIDARAFIAIGQCRRVG